MTSDFKEDQAGPKPTHGDGQKKKLQFPSLESKACPVTTHAVHVLKKEKEMANC